MKYNYFDIHSHLNLSQFRDDWEEIVKKLEEEKIGTITIGTNKQSSKKAIEIAKTSDFVFAGVGIHPTDNRDDKFKLDDYIELASDLKVVTIGECGLDYFRLEKDIENQIVEQKELFRLHLDLAVAVDKPLMIHCRPTSGTMDAYLDLIEIIKNYPLPTTHYPLRGNVHFFAGNLEVANKFIDLGFTLSFTGVITFSEDYDEIIKNVPLEKIHAETDAPFVAPVPYRGKRNEPGYVREVYKKIAEIRNEDPEKVREILLQNAMRFFGV